MLLSWPTNGGAVANVSAWMNTTADLWDAVSMPVSLSPGSSASPLLSAVFVVHVVAFYSVSGAFCCFKQALQSVRGTVVMLTSHVSAASFASYHFYRNTALILLIL